VWLGFLAGFLSRAFLVGHPLMKDPFSPISLGFLLYPPDDFGQSLPPFLSISTQIPLAKTQGAPFSPNQLFETVSKLFL